MRCSPPSPWPTVAKESGIPVAELGEVLLKNVRGAIALFSIGLVVGVSDTPIDPVCQQPVDRRAAVGRLSTKAPNTCSVR